MAAEKRKRYNATIKITRDQGERNPPHVHWHKVGVAYETKTGSINLILTSMPVIPSQWDGTIVLYPESELDKDQAKERGQARNAARRDDEDDDLPY